MFSAQTAFIASALPLCETPFPQFSRRRVVEGRISSDPSDHWYVIAFVQVLYLSASISAVNYQHLPFRIYRHLFTILFYFYFMHLDVCIRWVGDPVS